MRRPLATERGLEVSRISRVSTYRVVKLTTTTTSAIAFRARSRYHGVYFVPERWSRRWADQRAKRIQTPVAIPLLVPFSLSSFQKVCKIHTTELHARRSRGAARRLRDIFAIDRQSSLHERDFIHGVAVIVPLEVARLFGRRDECWRRRINTQTKTAAKTETENHQFDLR